MPGNSIFTFSFFRKPSFTPSLATAAVEPFSSAAFRPLLASWFDRSDKESAAADAAASVSNSNEVPRINAKRSMAGSWNGESMQSTLAIRGCVRRSMREGRARPGLIASG